MPIWQTNGNLAPLLHPFSPSSACLLTACVSNIFASGTRCGIVRNMWHSFGFPKCLTMNYFGGTNKKSPSLKILLKIMVLVMTDALLALSWKNTRR